MKVVMMTFDPIIDRRIIVEALSLHEQGWSVHILANKSPYSDPPEEKLYPQLSITRIDKDVAEQIRQSGSIDMGHFGETLKCFPNAAWDTFSVQWAYAVMQGIALDGDVYMAHDLPMLPLAAMAAKYHNGWCAYDAHEIYFEQRGLGVKQNRLFERVEKWCIALADEIFTVNQSIAEEMSKLERIQTPTVILNAPMSNEALSTDRTKKLHKLCEVADEVPILLYHGNLSFDRNLAILVEAMQFVEDQKAHLVLMGHDWSKDKSTRTALKKHIEKYRLESRVTILDPVSQESLLEYVRSATLGIIPYLAHEVNNYFCTPNKLCDFLATGTPILGTDLPELDRFISEQGVGINTSMFSPFSIAHGINEMLGSGYQKFLAAAQLVAPQYRWELQSQKLIQKFERFKIGKPPPNYWQIKFAELEIRRGNLLGAVDLLAQI